MTYSGRVKLNCFLLTVNVTYSLTGAFLVKEKLIDFKIEIMF